jgi:hypothetical protein
MFYKAADHLAAELEELDAYIAGSQRGGTWNGG